TLKTRYAVRVGTDRGQVGIVQSGVDPVVVGGAHVLATLERVHLSADVRKDFLFARAHLDGRERQPVQVFEALASFGKDLINAAIETLFRQIACQLGTAAARREPAR